jgi:hypothetical protein
VEELLAIKLRKLRGDTSRSELSRRTASPGGRYVPEKTIQALEENAGRVPEAEIIEALALALKVPPEDFYEWPIALARKQGKGVQPEDLPQVLEDAGPAPASPQNGHERKPPANAAKRRGAAPRKRAQS